MIDVDFRKKANWLQSKCVTKCLDVYGVIGNTTFFRCISCNKIVEANKILHNGQCRCGSRRFKETNLSLKEELYWVGRAFIYGKRAKNY